jgi:CopG family nickel-responsive transcriptional regulator
MAMASDLVRFSITMPETLLGQLDAYAARRGTSMNRSEVVRDLVRERLADVSASEPDGEVCGSITMVYDHHTPGLAARLDRIQHRHATEVVSSMHVHLDHDLCLEIVAVRGPARIIANMADCMVGLKGVRHGRLTTIGIDPCEHDEDGERHGRHGHPGHDAEAEDEAPLP